MKLSDIFQIIYPKTLIYSDMVPDKDGINFVSSQEKNNGIVGRVQVVDGTKIYPAGCITVPLKGSVLMAHLQPQQCYVAHQIAVLLPKNSMSLQEKLYYITLIRHNSYKYNYGRQADKTLGDIFIPDACKYNVARIKSLRYNVLTTRNKCEQHPLNIDSWQEFRLNDIFEIKRGESLYLNASEIGTTPYASASAEDNGISAYIDIEPNREGNCLSINYDGSVGEAYYHAKPFFASEKIVTATLKNHQMNQHIALFLATIIKMEKYRFSYGRKWTVESSMKKSVIRLPIVYGVDGTPYIKKELGYSLDGYVPDWDFMENYIKSLPYGDRV